MSSSSTACAKAVAIGGMAAHPAAVVEIVPDRQMRKQPAFLEHVADAPAPGRHVDARRARRTARRRRARCGRGPACSRPAIMLTMLVLPAPDGPNSAVAPPSLANCALSENSPSCFSTSTDQHRHAPCKSRAGAAGEPFRRDQRGERNDDRDDRPAAARRVAARHLRQRVDRRRDGLRLARNVGDEGDGGAELAERRGEASIMPAMMPGSASGSVTVTNSQSRLAPSVAAASSSRRSIASIDSRIARTISGNAITPQASAAPVQRNENTMPK